MRKRDIVLDFLKRYAVMTFGCALYALGVKIFIDHMGLAAGGATGIALICSQLFGWDTGIVLLIINVPLVALGGFYFGKKFFFSTIYIIAASSLMMTFTENYISWTPTDNLIISAVTGGAVFGFGMGLIFRMGGSSGGTDIPVKILRRKFRHIKTGMISMVSDCIIVGCSMLINPDFEVLFCTVLSIVIFTLVFDWVLYGGNSAKTVYIITSNEYVDAIKKRALEEIDTGVTLIDAEGGYTGQQKRIIFSVIKPYMFPKLRDIAHQEDKKAFIIVSSAKDIYGEGYQDPNAEEI